MEEDLFFEIRDRDNYIRIEPLDTVKYSSIDVDIKFKVFLKGGPFRGEITVDISTSDIIRFEKDLSSLYKKLNGKISFGDYYYLEVKIEGDGIGHFKTDVCARHNPEAESTLTFSLSFDQTQIEGMVNQLYKINKAYSIN